MFYEAGDLPPDLDGLTIAQGRIIRDWCEAIVRKACEDVWSGAGVHVAPDKISIFAGEFSSDLPDKDFPIESFFITEFAEVYTRFDDGTIDKEYQPDVEKALVALELSINAIRALYNPA